MCPAPPPLPHRLVFMPEDRSPIIDVTELPLDQLAGAEDNALRRSILEILGGLDAAAGTISGWTSFLDGEDSTMPS